jgi:hypothetical protein
MNIQEDKIVNIFRHTLDYAKNQNKEFNVITVIWHDNVLKMKGGRDYENILEYLSGQEDTVIGRGIDLANLIIKGKAPHI